VRTGVRLGAQAHKRQLYGEHRGGAAAAAAASRTGGCRAQRNRSNAAAAQGTPRRTVAKKRLEDARHTRAI